MPAHPTTLRGRRRRPKYRQQAARAEQYHLRAIQRALDVLEAFTDTRPELTLKDLSGLLGLSAESSLFRTLLTLADRGYLVQEPDGAYCLPPKLLYGRIYERAEQLRHSLRPYLQELARRFDETASLAYLFGDRIQVLDSVETFQEIRLSNKPGRVLPPHCSSLGKAITAFQPPELIDRILEVYGLHRRTERTIVDRQVLLAEFEQIRRRGWAADREESVVGGMCLGAPVTLEGRHVTTAISVSVPMVRMTPEREEAIARAVLQTAREAARVLGRQPSGRQE
jgi:DNA-binding IclR family transcriptional regulator